MARATAVWLMHNTRITDDQIARSCNLHVLELSVLRQGHLQGEDPLINGQLTPEEIRRCENNSSATLTFQNPLEQLGVHKKTKRYTPLAYRQNKPKAILWMLRHYSELSNNKMAHLLSTTTKTIQSIRDKTHPLSGTLEPHHPVLLGLCTEQQFQEVVASLQTSSPQSEQA